MSAYLLQEFTHTIVETEKSHNLPYSSWRTKKAGCVIQSQSEGWRIGGWGSESESLRTRNTGSESPRQQKMDV